LTPKKTKDTARKTALLVAEIQSEKKAENIVVIDVRGLCNFTDYFVISSASSTAQFKALSKHIQETLHKHKVKPFHIEDEITGNWMILDYNDVIIHIFSPEARDYYDIERLWGDGEIVEWQEELKPRKS
jgi:ribosome-associated protein